MLAVASGMRRASSIECFGGGGVFEEKVGRRKCHLYLEKLAAGLLRDVIRMHFFSWPLDASPSDVERLLDLELSYIALDIGGAQTHFKHMSNL
jgi:hypothetical protein